MSERINNPEERKNKLKELILKLHEGVDEAKVREKIIESLEQVPYQEVVEVEEELIAEGLPVEEVLKLCDIHAAVLHGNIDLSTYAEVPDGHPLDVMLKENIEIKKLGESILEDIKKIKSNKGENLEEELIELRGKYNALYDVDKHYKRKEYLIFPYLEIAGITGPPKVMWGKHDEIRELIKGSIEILLAKDISLEEFEASAEIVLIPTAVQSLEMIKKEEEILFPMSLDTLNDMEWYEIEKQSLEIGFCLYDPPVEWRPEWAKDEDTLANMNKSGANVQLPSGSFSVEELLAILNHLPIDMTFVDKDDKVKYFSQSSERLFIRNRSILNRDVRLCHPPGSSDIVEKIIEDFKSGKKSKAAFWIRMGEKLVHIEYFALRNDSGEYLGVLEVSHDVQRYRDLEGEQRILSYTE